MENKVLVQGVLKLEIEVSALLDYGDDFEECIAQLALNNIESAEQEIEILTDVDVYVDEETSEEFEGSVLSNSDWKSIVKKSREHENGN